jgi:predicted ribosome quality control (RQC) complex YloA/Tae2 family protein
MRRIMKEGVNSADIYVLARELQVLVGARFDKAYQAEDWLSFRFGVPGGGKREVFVQPGKWLALRDMEERPETPTAFAAAIRKHLDNARVTAVAQRGFDRLLAIRLERGEPHELLLEMFGKGNIVLATAGRITAVLHAQEFRDRVLRPDEPYMPPPGGLDPLGLTATEMTRTLRASKESVVKTLAAKMSLGGLYAEEICARAGVDKASKGKDLGESELGAVFASWAEVRGELDRPSPALLLRDGAAVDAAPIRLRSHASLERRELRTMSEAIVAYLEAAAAAPKPDPAVEKLRVRLDQQRETLDAARREDVRLGMLADLLYAHYAPFDELLRTLREGGDPGGQFVAAVDKRRKTVTVSVAGTESLELDYRQTVEQNAHRLYEARKEARAKAGKVARAMQDTEGELAKAVKHAEKAAKKARDRPKPTKPFWFEAYRWMISSEGFLVIGGRDAKTNDAIVRKHLKEGDRYAHADVHGAPSCVIKEGSRAGDATRRQACAFALAHSKAWSAGLASGSAFWVLPEQVSKQAETGEYLPRGAFVVRGKRNYIHDIPLRLAVAEVLHEGHRKVMGAPEEALSSAARMAVICPGEGDRDALARRLARAFQVPVEEVQRLLPPGGSAIVEAHGLDLG